MRLTSVVRKSKKNVWSIIDEDKEKTILNQKIIDKLNEKSVKNDEWYNIIYIKKINKDDPCDFIKEINFVSKN